MEHINVYGQALVASLERDIERIGEILDDRQRRIAEGRTDMDDCSLSEENDRLMLHGAKNKIALVKSGGMAWFRELATLDGTLVPYEWVSSSWGNRRKVSMPDGTVVYTSARTMEGLAKRGLKMVFCLRPAWYRAEGSGWGPTACWWKLFPSEFNYATGEKATAAPVQMRDCRDQDWIFQPWEEGV